MKTTPERMTNRLAEPGKRKGIGIVVASLIMLGCFSAQAQTVKITPLGSRTGEVCAQDRAFLLEDPTGVRILYDPGVPVAGGADARLGDVHVILLTHAHTDHLGANKLNQDPDAATAGCIAADIRTTPAQKSNVAEIAVAKNSAVISGFLLAPFLGGQIRSLRGVSTPACPATGQTNEMTVPRSSPCAGMLNVGGKRTITFQFIDLVAPMPVYLPRSGVTMEFDREGDCAVGCSRP